MPFATNNGFRIFYEVIASNGPPLILHHGLTSSGQNWKRSGYLTAIQDKFQIILIDGRGHGRSDKSDRPHDYRLSTRALDVIAVADHMNITDFHYWGYSMGASIGFGLMLNSTHRIRSLVLGGAQPYQVPAGGPILKALEQGPKAFLKMSESSGKTVPDDRRSEILSMDTNAIIAATQYPDESNVIVPAVRNFKRPTLIYSGAEDHNYDLISQIPTDNSNFEMVSLEGLNHMSCWSAVKKVTDISIEFINRNMD